jgi:lysophospholipase L1-like esterase
VDAKGGRTANDLLRQLHQGRWDVRAYKRVIVMLGDNDLTVKTTSGCHMRSGNAEDQLYQTLMECRLLLKTMCPDVLLCTILERPLLGAPMKVVTTRFNRRLINDLAVIGERVVPVARTVKAKHKAFYHHDGVHLSARGARRLARLLQEYSA